MTSPVDTRSPALDLVVGRFARMVRAVGRRHGLDPGELDEMIQDVRIRLWRARPSGETIAGMPSSYVYQAARSAALDLVRRQRGRALPSIEASSAEQVSAGRAPDRELEESELAELVYRGTETLMDSRRRVVRLYLLGYESGQIAAMLGWTSAKTRNLLSRGLADLRRYLGKAGVGPGGWQ